MRSFTRTDAVESSAAAYEMSGLGPADIDVVQIYDAFTINVIVGLEDLGFCAKGEGGRLVERGIGSGGALPVNTSGGGLRYCHPGMFGIFLLGRGGAAIARRSGRSPGRRRATCTRSRIRRHLCRQCDRRARARLTDCVAAMASSMNPSCSKKRHDDPSAPDRAVHLIDVTMRDGHQCLWSTRMTNAMIEPALDLVDGVGFHTVDIVGGAVFDVCVRYLHENPWARMRMAARGLSRTPLNVWMRGASLFTFEFFPYDVVEATIESPGIERDQPPHDVRCAERQSQPSRLGQGSARSGDRHHRRRRVHVEPGPHRRVFPGPGARARAHSASTGSVSRIRAGC